MWVEGPQDSTRATVYQEFDSGEALDKSRSMEIVLMETQNLHQQEVATRMEEPEGECGATHKVFKSSRGSCYRCGGVGHSSDSCYHKGKKCNECRW